MYGNGEKRSRARTWKPLIINAVYFVIRKGSLFYSFAEGVTNIAKELRYGYRENKLLIPEATEITAT